MFLESGALGLVVPLLIGLLIVLVAWRRKVKRTDGPGPESFALSPCPFCGKREARLVHDQAMDLHRVRCPRCEACGPWGMNPTQAAMRWSERMFRVE